MLSCLVIGLTGPVMRVNNCCLHVNPDASSSSKSHHFWNPLFVDVVAVKITDRGQVSLLELLLDLNVTRPSSSFCLNETIYIFLFKQRTRTPLNFNVAILKSVCACTRKCKSQCVQEPSSRETNHTEHLLREYFASARSQNRIEALVASVCRLFYFAKRILEYSAALKLAGNVIRSRAWSDCECNMS